MGRITIEYCSKYKSYDGTPVTEGKVLAPVVISDAEYKHNNAIIKENLKTWKHNGVKFRVGFMVVDEKDFNKMRSLYYACINEYFEEHPELRPGRCLLGIDKGGMPILCSKDNRCKGCSHRDEHLPRYKNLENYIRFVSLSDTHEDEEDNEANIEIADPAQNPENTVLLSIMIEELITFLNKANPRYGKMISLLLDGKKPTDIFKAVGLKSSFGYTELDRAKELARQFLTED